AAGDRDACRLRLAEARQAARVPPRSPQRPRRTRSLRPPGVGGADVDDLGRRPRRQPRWPGDRARRHGALSAALGAARMNVDVRYFAAVREALGSGERVEIDAGATIATLRDALARRGGRHAEALGRER